MPLQYQHSRKEHLGTQVAELAGYTSLSRPDSESAPLVQSIRQELVIEGGQTPTSGRVERRRGVSSVVFWDTKRLGRREGTDRVLAEGDGDYALREERSSERLVDTFRKLGQPDMAYHYKHLFRSDAIFAAQAYSLFALLRILPSDKPDDLHTFHYPYTNITGEYDSIRMEAEEMEVANSAQGESRERYSHFPT
ncbi:hypothetical protein EDB85DRAFT_1889974 [Lactarius pseudohatsudake]|nr:hypothetical protein EDB85DRAFT_1889974 [Lactarius pseudohatsudake]